MKSSGRKLAPSDHPVKFEALQVDAAVMVKYLGQQFRAGSIIGAVVKDHNCWKCTVSQTGHFARG